MFITEEQQPMTHVERKRMERSRDEYVIENGLMYRIWVDIADRLQPSTAIRLLVVPRKHRNQLMEALHDNFYGGGHLGFDRIMGRAKSQFYWRGMARDIQEFIKTCPTCQRRNVTPVATGFLQNPEIPTQRWRHVAMDIVGPTYRPTDKGNRYILVCVDYLTRWPEAYPMPDQSAATVAKIWINEIISRHGVPERVLTDCGKNFTSELLRQVNEHLGMDHHRTTPYHPQTNGLVERFNRTLKDMIAKLTEERDDDWDELLPWSLACYRSTPSVVTGDTPFFLMHGRDPYFPIDTMQGIHGKHRDLHTEDKFRFLTDMDKVAELVKESIEKTQKYMKARYDTTAKDRPVKPGDLVKIKIMKRGKGGKLRNRYIGPCRVKGRAGKLTNVFIVEVSPGVTKTLNVRMLAPWFDRLKK
jgi:transposase InsO family protein